MPSPTTDTSLRTKEVASVAEEVGRKGRSKAQDNWSPGDHRQDRPRNRQSSDAINCSNHLEGRGEVTAGKPLQRLNKRG